MRLYLGSHQPGTRLTHTNWEYWALDEEDVLQRQAIKRKRIVVNEYWAYAERLW